MIFDIFLHLFHLLLDRFHILLHFYILLLLFIPCNNQIAQSNENLCAFLLLIGMWLICGRGAPKAANED